MKVVIIGLGSIGNRYAGILKKHYHFQVFALRENRISKNIYGIEELYEYKELQNIKPDFVIVSNTTDRHVGTVLNCIKYCNKFFIEKPLGSSVKQIDKLISIIKKQGLITYVAYNLRFHPVIKRVREYFNEHIYLHSNVTCTSYLPNWRPGTDFLKSYSANRNKGGGVLLDLSHEIDYMKYLLGNIISIKGNSSKKGNITNDSEDNADLLIKYEKGYSNIHLSYLSHLKQRTLHIDFENISIIADLIKYKITECKNEKVNRVYHLKKRKNESYVRQLEYFIGNINNHNMMNSVNDNYDTIKRIINFRENPLG